MTHGVKAFTPYYQSSCHVRVEVFARGVQVFALRGVTSSSTRNLTVRFTIPAWPFARSPNDVKSHVVVSKLEKLVCKQ
jgi:hypothetical protein